MATPIILPPPALASSFNPSRLILKLMSALPALCAYAGVEVHDLTSVDQWRACGNACLLKVGLALEDGPKKEVYNVVAIWLRVIATTHQEDVSQVTMLVQQWFNLFGRWPITIAFFASCVPSGDKAGADKVPDGLKGDMYDAAMLFKSYLTDLAKLHYGLPMVPVFWEDNFALRIALSRLLHTSSPVSPNMAQTASSALESRNGSTTNDKVAKHTPSASDTTVQGLKNLSLVSPASPGSSEDASTPRGLTDASDADESEVGPDDGGRGDISEQETNGRSAPAAAGGTAMKFATPSGAEQASLS